MVHGNSSEKIRQIIKETGVKQVHLAKKLGITPQHLNKILERNQQTGSYIPKISKILGIDIPSIEEKTTSAISIFSETELASLATEHVLFEDLEKTSLHSWPNIKNQEIYQFGYKVKDSVNSCLWKNDTVIFSTCIPLKLEKKIGIAFIQENNSIVVGIVKKNKGKIIIYNDNDFYLFTSKDLLLGVAISLGRNIENLV